jgi:undecaprenyl pyrophosphate phosphatase UppP
MPQGSELFGVAPRVFAAVGSGVAAVVIIGGAVWSIIRVIRGRIPAVGEAQRHITNARRHAASNTLIAVGTLVLSASGTLAGRMGEDRAFAITLLVGIVILFSGFLVASNQANRSQRTAQKLAEGIAR